MARTPITLRREDDRYPAALRRLTRPPAMLHVDGSLDGIERAIAIVGTRRATPAALELARSIGRELAERDVLVVSGGAEGIDRAAHEGALEAKRGRTLAVLPTALATPYPRSHAPLFERIARRGACITEHVEPSRAVHRAHFLERNRIIAALSRGVIVIQAPWKSGALRTALDAKLLGIPVLASPWSPTEDAAMGGLDLLARGAGLCRNVDDALRVLGENAPKQIRKKARAKHQGDEAALLACLDDTAIDRETLVRRAGLDAARVQSALLQLVLDDAVFEDARGVRRR